MGHQAARCSPVALPPGGGSARPASGMQRGSASWTLDCRRDPGGRLGGGREAEKKRWIYVQCGGMCMLTLGTGCQTGAFKPHCPPPTHPFFALLCRICSNLPTVLMKEQHHFLAFQAPSSHMGLCIASSSRCGARVGGTDQPRCVAGWSIRAQRLLSLVLTAVHARRGGDARSRRIPARFCASTC